MRNYRIVTKQNNLSAWGSGRSQVISPVVDSIHFELNIKSFTLKDNIEIVSDSINLEMFPLLEPKVMKDEIKIGLTDSIQFLLD